MSETGNPPDRARARLDQWLWFARFVKSRSLAARLCTGGVLAVNDVPVAKANHSVRIGDVVIIELRGVRRIVRILALGTRRGPAGEARMLYEEVAPAVRLAAALTDWVPLLGDEEAAAESRAQPLVR